MDVEQILNHIETLKKLLLDANVDDGTRDDCAMYIAEIHFQTGKILYDFVKTNENMEILIDSATEGLTDLWRKTETLDPYIIKMMSPPFKEHTVNVLLRYNFEDKLREQDLLSS